MDIPRAPQRKIGKYVLPAGGVLLLLAAVIGYSRLQPSAPTVTREELYLGTVERGEMLRQVGGPGTLVPENIRWISAVTSGRVEEILARPGDTTRANSVIMRLSNPDVQMEALQAQRQLSAEEATLVNLETTLSSQRLAQEGQVAGAKAAHSEAQRQLQINTELASRNLIAASDLARSREVESETRTRLSIAEKQLQLFVGSIQQQIDAQRLQVERAKAIADFQERRVASMSVVAGADGVLTELPLEIGQWANSGATLAKVVEPGRLKAVLRIPETQAREITIGQSATVDTRTSSDGSNGVIRGRVVRIDPASQGGTVSVDIALETPLPQVARPDLNIDGTIELERLSDVLYVGRPSAGQSSSTIDMFRLSDDGKEAHRVRVTLGSVSVRLVEIRAGLAAADRVILGDISEFDGFDRIVIR